MCIYSISNLWLISVLSPTYCWVLQLSLLFIFSISSLSFPDPWPLSQLRVQRSHVQLDHYLNFGLKAHVYNLPFFIPLALQSLALPGCYCQWQWATWAVFIVMNTVIFYSFGKKNNGKKNFMFLDYRPGNILPLGFKMLELRWSASPSQPCVSHVLSCCSPLWQPPMWVLRGEKKGKTKE